MLRLYPLEFILRTIPESCLIMLTAYLISFKPIKKKRYILASILLAVSIYLIRLLPIDYGINTLINIPIYILLCTKISKIPINKAIISALIVPLVVSICEYISIGILQVLLHKDVNVILSNQLDRILYFSPTIIIFAFIVSVFYVCIYKSKVKVE